MAKIAALFPGQGSQAVGMGQDVAQEWPEAAQVFESIDAALEADLSGLCWNGPEEDLKLTENTQPALLAHAVAVWRVLEARGFAVDAVAGHSLGEYSAIVAAGGLSAEDAARTVRARGRLMQQAVPVGQGAMAAVIGMDDDAVRGVCTEASGEGSDVVVAANFNAPGQVVIAGGADAVARAITACKEAGARRAVPLPVSAPFHSPLMAPAREGLTPTLRELDFADLRVPLYRNVDASPVTAATDLCDGLIRQVDAPVLWSATIQRMVEDGFDTFVEVGTGKVLSGLVRRIHKDATCHAAGTVDTITAVLDELGSD
jgi:[acyl-carrier-protein] S-malonyltransferase